MLIAYCVELLQPFFVVAQFTEFPAVSWIGAAGQVEFVCKSVCVCSHSNQNAFIKQWYTTEYTFLHSSSSKMCVCDYGYEPAEDFQKLRDSVEVLSFIYEPKTQNTHVL